MPFRHELSFHDTTKAEAEKLLAGKGANSVLFRYVMKDDDCFWPKLSSNNPDVKFNPRYQVFMASTYKGVDKDGRPFFHHEPIFYDLYSYAIYLLRDVERDRSLARDSRRLPGYVSTRQWWEQKALIEGDLETAITDLQKAKEAAKKVEMIDERKVEAPTERKIEVAGERKVETTREKKEELTEALKEKLTKQELLWRIYSPESREETKETLTVEQKEEQRLVQLEFSWQVYLKSTCAHRYYDPNISAEENVKQFITLFCKEKTEYQFQGPEGELKVVETSHGKKPIFTISPAKTLVTRLAVTKKSECKEEKKESKEEKKETKEETKREAKDPLAQLKEDPGFHPDSSFEKTEKLLKEVHLREKVNLGFFRSYDLAGDGVAWWDLFKETHEFFMFCAIRNETDGSLKTIHQPVFYKKDTQGPFIVLRNSKKSKKEYERNIQAGKSPEQIEKELFDNDGSNEKVIVSDTPQGLFNYFFQSDNIFEDNKSHKLEFISQPLMSKLTRDGAVEKRLVKKAESKIAAPTTPMTSSSSSALHGAVIPADRMDIDVPSDNNCLFWSVGLQWLLDAIGEAKEANQSSTNPLFTFPPAFASAFGQLFGVFGHVNFRTSGSGLSCGIDDPHTIEAAYQMLLVYDGNKDTPNQFEGGLLSQLIREVSRARLIDFMRNEPTKEDLNQVLHHAKASYSGKEGGWEKHLKDTAVPTAWPGTAEFAGFACSLNTVVYVYHERKDRSGADLQEIYRPDRRDRGPTKEIHIIYAFGSSFGEQRGHYRMAFLKKHMFWSPDFRTPTASTGITHTATTASSSSSAAAAVTSTEFSETKRTAVVNSLPQSTSASPADPVPPSAEDKIKLPQIQPPITGALGEPVPTLTAAATATTTSALAASPSPLPRTTAVLAAVATGASPSSVTVSTSLSSTAAPKKLSRQEQRAAKKAAKKEAGKKASIVRSPRP